MDGTASSQCTRAWERNERSHSVGHLFLLLDGLLYLFIFPIVTFGYLLRMRLISKRRCYS